MSLRAIAAVIGVAAIACGPATAQGGAPMRCEIQVDGDAQTVQLRGIITSTVAVPGTYRLQAVKSGPFNNSNVEQSGTFKVTPDAPVTVGSVTLSGGGRTDAVLTITWRDGTTECRQIIGAPP